MLVGEKPRRVAIVGGVRIPFAAGNGAYAQVGNQEMLTAVLRGIVERHGLQGQRLDDVAAGAVMKHSSQWNLTRESVLGSGLAAETPGLDLQRACGTSLEAAILLGNKIALGQIDCAVAAGVDNRERSAGGLSEELSAAVAAKLPRQDGGAAPEAWFGLRMKNLRPVLPGIAEPRTGLSMGESTELMVKTWGISRAEQDQLALESHQKAAAAYAAGFYQDLVLRLSGTRPGQQHPQRYHAREIGKTQAGLRFVGRRHLDRRELHSDDGWRIGGAARERSLGAPAKPARTGIPELRQGGGGGLRREEGGSAHGAGLCRPPHAERRKAIPAGLRLLRDP